VNKRVQKPLRSVVAKAIERGWTIEETRSQTGHTLRLRFGGRTVPLHCSKVSEGLAPKKLNSQLLRIERGQ
jgi:hypothetical protein